MNIYDFDNTIYDGDCTTEFYLFCLKRNIQMHKLLPGLIKACVNFFILKRWSKTQFKEKIYEFMGVIYTESELKVFWESHFKKIKSWYIENHKEDDIVISASPEFILKPACEKLGIKYLIASRVSPVDGKYTGINCDNIEKVKRFRQEFDGEIDEFYSDSYNDTPLAEISKKAFMVKKDEITEWVFK